MADEKKKPRIARIARLLDSLPQEPGIYVFRDAQGRVLYVGKAKSLRRRVMSYFRRSGPGNGSIRMARMLGRVEDFDFVVTSSETEALLLESNFIKHHRPPYNICLRDDKSYPYVAVTLDEEYPRVMLTRKPHRPRVAYFGPYTNAGKVRETLDLLGKGFPYRKCRGAKPGRHSGTPCLNYHIGRCLAPCEGKVGVEDYRLMINRVVRLLSGKPEGLAEELEEGIREGGFPAQPPAVTGASAGTTAGDGAGYRQHGCSGHTRGRRRRQRPGAAGAGRCPQRPAELLSEQCRG
jgi:excinuclease ABC subunit C